jgi:hypothetical protein
MSIRFGLNTVDEHGATSGMRRSADEIVLYAPSCEAVKDGRTDSVQRFLRTPAQSSKIRVFATLVLGLVGLSGFTLKAAFFLLTLFHLPRLLTISFCERCFAWSCDDVLLGLRRRRRARACVMRMLLGGAALPFSS